MGEYPDWVDRDGNTHPEMGMWAAPLFSPRLKAEENELSAGSLAVDGMWPVASSNCCYDLPAMVDWTLELCTKTSPFFPKLLLPRAFYHSDRKGNQDSQPRSLSDFGSRDLETQKSRALCLPPSVRRAFPHSSAGRV